MADKEDTFRDAAPIENPIRETMNAVAAALDETFNGDAEGTDRKIGFVVLVFPFGDPENNGENKVKRFNFISNGADRRDLIILFKEMIRKFEGQPEIQGNA